MTNDQKKWAAWWREYNLRNALEMPEDEKPSEGEGPRRGDFAGEPPPADGQIRLWPGAAGPIYGWLKALGYDRWLVVPFSSLAVPASPAEYRWRDAGPAQVLQAWNARGITGKTAAWSWRVDGIPETERFELEAWLTAARDDGNASGPWEERAGPPLRHPLDPRQAYFEAEAERVGEFFGDAVETDGADRDDLPRAAESPEREYGDPPPRG